MDQSTPTRGLRARWDALAGPDRASVLLAGLLAVVVVATIGRPLVGLGSLHAADTMQALDPWAQTAPDGFRPDNGTVSDTVDAVAPVRLAIAERAREGDLALWSTTQGGGAPLLGLPNTAMLSPLNVPWWLAPGHAAPALAKALQMLVAAAGMVLFTRRMGASRPAAGIAALAFVNAGFLVVWTTWPQSNVAALLPWLFWAADRATVPSSREPAGPAAIVPVALVGAVMWLEGFPALTAWAHVFAGAFALVRIRACDRALLPGLGRPAAGMGLGLGIAAVQLVPFGFRMAELDTSSRAAKAADALPWESMATVLAPKALGSAGDGVWYGPRNEVELQAFLGAAGLALVVAGVAAGRRRSSVGGWVPYALGATVAVALLVWAGGVVNDAVQALPVLGGNQTGRLRGLLAFLLAGLVAVGVDAVRPGGGDPQRWTPRLVAGGAVTLALLAPALWRAWRLAQDAGRTGFADGALLFPAAAFVAALAVLGVAATARRAHVRHVAIGMVSLALAVESIAFARTFLPRIDTDRFYPRTVAHDVVADLADTDRFAVGGLALYPGTTTAYGLRSVTAHAGMPRAWRELLLEVDPTAYDRNATFPILTASPDVAASPVLDLLGATTFVTEMAVPVFGDRQDPVPNGTVLGTGRAVHGADVDREAVHRALADHDLPAALVVEVRDEREMVVARGQRRITGREDATWLSVPLAPATPSAPPATRGRVVASLQLDPPVADGTATTATAVRVALPEDARVRPVRARAGGPRVVAAPGVVVYARPGALPRVRLERPDGSVADRAVRDLDDGEDVLLATVDAPVAGTLVVADAWSGGHRATVDGEPVDVEVVHGALVGIDVPSGAHEVRLWWEPEGIRPGAAVTVLSLLACCLAGIAHTRRREGQAT